MFKLVLFIGLGIALANAGNIDVNKIYGVVDTDTSALLHANLDIGANLNQINKPTWKQTLNILVPNIRNAKKGLVNTENALQNFITNLQQENKNQNSQDVYIPDSVLEANYAAVAAMNKAFNNIVITKLAATVAANEKELASVNGNVIIPRQLAAKFVSLLSYIKSQFFVLQQTTAQFENALLELAEALSQDSNSGLGSFVFKHSSNAAKSAANQFGIIANDFGNLIASYEKLARLQPNGEILLSANALNQATNAGVQKIADEFNRIADALQLLQNKISAPASL